MNEPDPPAAQFRSRKPINKRRAGGAAGLRDVDIRCTVDALGVRDAALHTCSPLARPRAGQRSHCPLSHHPRRRDAIRSAPPPTGPPARSIFRLRRSGCWSGHGRRDHCRASMARDHVTAGARAAPPCVARRRAAPPRHATASHRHVPCSALRRTYFGVRAVAPSDPAHTLLPVWS